MFDNYSNRYSPALYNYSNRYSPALYNYSNRYSPALYNYSNRCSSELYDVTEAEYQEIMDEIAAERAAAEEEDRQIIQGIKYSVWLIALIGWVIVFGIYFWNVDWMLKFAVGMTTSAFFAVMFPEN